MADSVGAVGSASGYSATQWAQYNTSVNQGVDNDGDHDGSGSAAAQALQFSTSTDSTSGTQGTQQTHRGHHGHHGHRGTQSTQGTTQSNALQSNPSATAPTIASLLTQLDADGDHDGSTSANTNSAFKSTVAQQLSSGTLGTDPLANYNPDGTQDAQGQTGVGNLVNTIA